MCAYLPSCPSFRKSPGSKFSWECDHGVTDCKYVHFVPAFGAPVLASVGNARSSVRGGGLAAEQRVPGRKTSRRRGVLFPRQLRTVVFLPWVGVGSKDGYFVFGSCWGSEIGSAHSLLLSRSTSCRGFDCTVSSDVCLMNFFRAASVRPMLSRMVSPGHGIGEGAKFDYCLQKNRRSAPGRGLNNTREVQHQVCSSPVPAPTGVIFSGRRSSHRQLVMPFDCWASPGIA